MFFRLFLRRMSDAEPRANPSPPDEPPDIYGVFVARGYRTTYANFVKCPQ
jgi:hypothetical protein